MKTNFLNFKTFFTALVIFCATNTAFGATLYSRQNSDWTDINAWSLTQGGASAGVIPTAADDVFIDHTIKLTNIALSECRHLNIRNNGRLEFNVGSTTNLFRVWGNFLISTGGTFVQHNNQGYPVEIYGNLIIDGTYITTNQNSGFVKITMKGNGGPTRFLGGANFSNNNNERRFVDLTIDLATPNDVINLQNDIYFAEVNANNPNVVKLNVVQGIFNATGRTIYFQKFGQIITTANGRIAWKNIDCDYEAPNIHWITPESGSDLVVTSPHPLYINNFTFGAGKENFKFPNNSNAKICILGNITRDKSNQDYGTGQFFWGPNSNYIRTNSAGTAEPNPSSGANGPANISGVPNAAYQPPAIIQQYLDACSYALDMAEPTITNVDCKSISIEWDTVAGTDSYRIYTSTTNITDTVYYTTILQSSNVNGVCSAVISGLNAGQTYYIWVKAEAGASDYSLSNPISATTTAKPAPIVSVITDNNTLKISWHAVPNAINYTLYRCTSALMTVCDFVASGNNLFEYEDTGLDEYTVYYYKVVADFIEGCTSETRVSGVTAAPCGSSCSTLMGFTNFAYNGGTPPARWSVTQIQYGGIATQSIDMSGTGYVPGGTINPGYSIMPNPNAAVTTAAFMMDSVRTDGGAWCIIRSAQNPALTYRISGLNPSTAPAGEKNYCVRVKMRVVGNNVSANYPNSTPFGSNFNVDIQTLTGGAATVTNGRYMSINPLYNDNYNGIWTGQNSLSGLTYSGSYAIVEGTVTITQGDGFQIRIRTTHQNLYFAVESIEVYGCTKKVIQVLDAGGTLIATNPGEYEICSNEWMKLSATQGFADNDEEIIWTKTVGGVTTQVGTGKILDIRGHAVGDTVIYTATGPYGYSQIIVYSKFCCHAVSGELITVFAEHFNMSSYTNNVWACLPTPVGGEIASLYRCATNPNDGYYCVAKTTNNWYDWGNFAEHTCYAGDANNEPSEYRNVVYPAPGTPSVPAGPACNSNSGMLIVNARNLSGSSDLDYFYQQLLTGLCDNTYYEFSVWYASVSPASAKPNITFDVCMADADGTVPVGRLPIVSYNTGEVRDYRVWHKITLNFTTPTGTGKYRLRVLNKCLSTAGGNDIAIDDIVVKKCVTRIAAVDIVTNLPTAQVCEFTPSPVTLGFDAEYCIKDVVGYGGDVWVQWAWSTSPTGPWTKLTPEAVLNDTIRIIYPIGDGQPYYYMAKLSADKARAEDLSASLTANCGNDIFSGIFSLRRLEAIEIDITSSTHNVVYNNVTHLYDTLRVCKGSDFNLVGNPSSAAMQWNWSFNTPNIISLSSDAANKTFTKTNAQLTDEGKYYFYTKNSAECDAIDSIYVQILPAGETYYDTVCDNQLPYLGRYLGYGFTDINSGGIHTTTIGGCQFYLNLKVNSTFLNEQTDTISDRDLPYVWTGHGKTFNAAGTYYDSLQTTNNTRCDSIYKLNLIVKQTIRITKRDTICQPDVYEFYGKIFNTNTFIVDSLVIGAGATNDTIFNLSLWVGQPYFREFPDQICSGAPYNRNGFNITNPQTQMYEQRGFTSLGCDSIVRLNLTVNQPIETHINATICEGDRYNDNGFNESVQGTYHIDERTSAGCDSIVYLHLSVDIPFSVDDFVITEDLCQGDLSFTFEIPLGTTTNNVNCLINFVPNVGFTPTSATVNQSNNKITVTIPQGTPAGTYEMFITFKEDGANCFAPPTKVTFTINLSIIEQKWDDVIAVLNQTYGGYDFEIYSYQWYKGGEPLSGKTGSYLYTYPDKLNIGSYYYVVLVTSDGVVQSCWLYPKEYIKCADCPQFIEVELLPNAQIKTNQPGVASIYNVQGILVGSQNFLAGTTELSIHVPQGIYILQVVLKDGYSKAFKFIK